MAVVDKGAGVGWGGGAVGRCGDGECLSSSPGEDKCPLEKQSVFMLL